MEYAKIQSLPTASAKQHEVEQQLSQAKYVGLTDALTNIGRGGEYVLQLLADEQLSSFRGAGEMRTWKIKVLCDKWGQPMKPGDVVSWEVPKSIRVNGKKMDSRQIKAMVRRGERAKLYDVHQYTIGADGCIVCGYADACHLLNQFGVHYDSGIAVTSRRKMSREPTPLADGTKATQHFWRYSEVPPGYEEEIKAETPEPTLEAPKKKRAYKPRIKKAEPTEAPAGEVKEDGESSI